MVMRFIVGFGLFAFIMLVAFENSRGMPDWCYWPLAHINGCLGLEFDAFYYGGGNPWPKLKCALAIQGQGPASWCNALYQPTR